jgi:bifunctional non-homologous end joining protein LigD
VSGVGDGPLEVAGRTVEVSHAAKVLFPGDDIDKGDLVGYYRDVSELMLPHIVERPLTLQRYPDGIGAGGFYQKEASDHFPDWIATVGVPRRGEGGEVNHVVCDDAATLVYLANQGTITFHVTPARSSHLDVPDVVVFDLDPTEDADLAPVRAAARTLRDVLRAVGLEPFLQTTGSKGYHVVVPVEPRYDFERARAFARALAEVVATRDPAHLTTEVRKAKRGGRVFLDTARNGYAQTFVAPYSVRPRAGAPVATPLDWDELGRIDPRAYTVRNVRRRLAQKEDPWADLAASQKDLRAAAGRLDELRAEEIER